tara:strand:+ start:270 stop:515 length:246 start_codon:yes stop_codon:yes gene_type:complete
MRNNNIKIEKGIKPPKDKPTMTRRALLLSLEINDSFLVSELERGPYQQAAISIRRKTNDKFKIVTSGTNQKSGYVRIWRTQ